MGAPMKFKVNHLDPARMDGLVDRDQQGWEDIEADDVPGAAEQFLRDWWNNDPVEFPYKGPVSIWVRQPDRSDVRVDVGINWEPSFFASRTTVVERANNE